MQEIFYWLTISNFLYIIVLLILAGVSLSGIIGGKGLFKRTEDASNKYNEAKAREVLETVLLGTAQYEKNSNSKYNQDDFLDELIKKEIPGSDIKGDVAIIGGKYAYELDRSVPKIGHYLGNPKDLIFPVVTVAEITQADPEYNYRTAKIEIKATIEEKAENGINRIEIWQNGVKLDTIDCNNEKNITTEYKANKNGAYIIKAYSKITDTEIPNAETSGSAKTTVEGIVPAIEFSPNGNKEWKKSHTTTVKLKETEQTVTNMKYLWKKIEEGEPQLDAFTDTESCANNSQIQGKTMTGKYCLWVLVTFGTGANQKNYINGSEEFYFDNETPTVELTSIPVSETSFTLTATASDTKSGIAKYEFYIDGEKKEPTTVENGKATYTWNGTEMRDNVQVTVTVYDLAGNKGNNIIYDARTQMHTWDTYDVIKETKYIEKVLQEVYEYFIPSGQSGGFVYVSSGKTFDVKTGIFGSTGTKFATTISDYVDYLGNSAVGKYYTPDSGINMYYLQRFIRKWSDDAGQHASWDAQHYYGEKCEDTIQGNTKKATIRNKNEDLFPKNNYDGDTWYKYIGLS